jgi:hypothetical protein
MHNEKPAGRLAGRVLVGRQMKRISDLCYSFMPMRDPPLELGRRRRIMMARNEVMGEE